MMGRSKDPGGGVIDDGAVKGPGCVGGESLMMGRSKDRGGGGVDDGAVRS